MTTNTPNTRAFRFASTLIACVFALSTPTAPALAQPAPPPGPTFEPARDAPFTSPTEITLYIKYYYLNPNPLRIGHAVDFLSANAVGIEEPRALVPAHAALGRLLRTDPSRIERWLRTTMSRDEPERVLFAANCAWWSDTDEGDEIVARLAAIAPDNLRTQYRILQNTAPPLIEGRVPTEGIHMDILWASFFVTASTDFIDPFFPLLAGRTTPNLDITALDRADLFQSAVWSVASNAYQHEPVLAYLREQSNDHEDPAVREALIDIVASVDKRIETDGPPFKPQIMRRLDAEMPDNAPPGRRVEEPSPAVPATPPATPPATND